MSAAFWCKLLEKNRRGLHQCVWTSSQEHCRTLSTRRFNQAAVYRANFRGLQHAPAILFPTVRRRRSQPRSNKEAVYTSMSDVCMLWCSFDALLQRKKGLKSWSQSLMCVNTTSILDTSHCWHPSLLYCLLIGYCVQDRGRASALCSAKDHPLNLFVTHRHIQNVKDPALP